MDKREGGAAVDPELLTSEEVAGLVRLHPEYFRHCYRAGRLPGFPRAVRVGSKRIWWACEVRQWMQSQRESVQP